MTRVDASAHVGELGVVFLADTCARARVIFRPIRMFDVGVDGIVEPEHGNMATGTFIAVQVKAGPSFVESNGDFRFTSNREHFAYWGRCSVPVLGVVFDPARRRGVWLSLTGIATAERIRSGPYSERVAMEAGELTPKSLLEQAIPTVVEAFRRRGAAIPRLPRPATSTNRGESDRLEAWESRIAVFLSSVHTDRQVAAAGYALAGSLPLSADDPRRPFMEDCLRTVNDLQLAKMLAAVDRAIRDNRDDVGEQLISVIALIPEAVARIRRLLAYGGLRKGAYLGAIQTVELLEGDFRPDLWAHHSEEE